MAQGDGWLIVRNFKVATSLIFLAGWTSSGWGSSPAFAATDDYHIVLRAVYAVQSLARTPPADWSYRTISKTPTGSIESIFDFRDNRIKSVTSSIKMIDTYGSVSYLQDRRTGKWTKYTVSPTSYRDSTWRKSTDFGPLKMKFLHGPKLSKLATVIVFVEPTVPQLSSASAKRRIPVKCTYERATYRVRSCSSNSSSITYDRYNDASNKFTIPEAALRAPPLRIDGK